MVEAWGPDLSDCLPANSPRAGIVQRWHLGKSEQVSVYFMSASEAEVPGGPIKIGISAHPAARLAEMQQVCPVRLEILALCAGGAKREAEYHALFAESRLHGEWFARTEPLLKLIGWHKARSGLSPMLRESAK